jgi:hypothetical protein
MYNSLKGINLSDLPVLINCAECHLITAGFQCADGQKRCFRCAQRHADAYLRLAARRLAGAPWPAFDGDSGSEEYAQP